MPENKFQIHGYTKDGGEEVFPKTHCVLFSNPYRFVNNY